MRTTTVMIPIAALLLSVGCAKVNVRPVANSFGSTGKALESKEAGVRFYRPAPHVWITQNPPSEKVNVAVSDDTTVTKKDDVTTTKKTTATVPASPASSYSAKLEMLPDYSQEYVIQWSAGMGNVKPKFALTNGWNLTSFTSEIESKVSDNINALSGAAKNFSTIAAGALVSNSNFKGPGLYRLDVDSSGRLQLGHLVLGLD